MPSETATEAALFNIHNRVKPRAKIQAINTPVQYKLSMEGLATFLKLEVDDVICILSYILLQLTKLILLMQTISRKVWNIAISGFISRKQSLLSNVGKGNLLTL